MIILVSNLIYKLEQKSKDLIFFQTSSFFNLEKAGKTLALVFGEIPTLHIFNSFNLFY